MEAIFSAPVQTVPGANPASCTMGNGSLPRVKRPVRGADHPHPLAPRLKKKYSYTSPPSLDLHRVTFSFLMDLEEKEYAAGPSGAGVDQAVRSLRNGHSLPYSNSNFNNIKLDVNFNLKAVAWSTTVVISALTNMQTSQ